MSDRNKKKFFSLLLVISISISSLLPLANVYGAEANDDVWIPNCTGKDENIIGFSRDNTIIYNGKASLLLENKENSVNSYFKTFDVKKNTIYRIKAMVKYADYKRGTLEGWYNYYTESGVDLSSIEDAESMVKNTCDSSSGAYIAATTADITKTSKCNNKNEWKELEMTINSGDSETLMVWLCNGSSYGGCSGKAYFSNFKIEEKTDMAPTTEWNVLYLIYQNVNFTLPIYEGQKDYKYKGRLTSWDIDNINKAIEKTPETFKELSGGLITIGAQDTYVIEKTLTSISEVVVNNYGDSRSSYAVDAYKDVNETLDEYLAKGKKQYNQIFVIMPIFKIDEYWLGLGGNFYKNIGFAQVSYEYSFDIRYWDFPEEVFVHETLHCLETLANSRDAEVLPLHYWKENGYEIEAGKSMTQPREFYGDYMKNTLKTGANGIPKETYTVYNGAFTTLSTEIKSVMDVKPIALSEAEKEERFTAVPTLSKILLDGKSIEFDSYNINGYNYFKLRDISSALYGTGCTFGVDWLAPFNAISMLKGYGMNAELSPKGTEEKSAVRTSSLLFFNCSQVDFEAYNIDGYNYFKLRDIAETVGFAVDWDEITNTVIINTL